MTIRMLVAYADQDKAHEEAVKFCIQVGGTYNHTRKTVTLGKLEIHYLGFPSLDWVVNVAGFEFQNSFVSNQVPDDVKKYLKTRVRSQGRFLGLARQFVTFDEETGDVV